MSLRLIDSDNNPLASELVPFANSYDVRGVYNPAPVRWLILNHWMCYTYRRRF